MSFKPYYKWITFNIKWTVILGSIALGFKPYYKWITFNIYQLFFVLLQIFLVLNLIINGLPSISSDTVHNKVTYEF